MKVVREHINESSFLETIKNAKKGPLRKEEFDDGWYVVGEGNIISVNNETDADKILKKMKNSES